MNICKFCGVKNEVVTICFLWNPNKWTVHRTNTDEVTYEIYDRKIRNASKRLTVIEINYIAKHIFKLVKDPPQKNMIINYAARGYTDKQISDILSIPIYEIKPVITRYWKDKMRNQK